MGVDHLLFYEFLYPIGKSTLLNHIASYSLPGFPAHLRVVYVHQSDMVSSEEKVIDYVVNSDVEKTFLEQEEERLYTVLENFDENEEHNVNGEQTIDEINEQIAAITERLSDMDVHRAELRAGAILSGLGFTSEKQKAPINSLSGGWRNRVKLACGLFVHVGSKLKALLVCNFVVNC